MDNFIDTCHRFLGSVHKNHVSFLINPLSPKSDQHEISLCNINAL